MTPNGTSAVARHSPQPAPSRVDWVDYAKGICIVMVVMMHSVLGVEAAAGQTGFMHLLVAFAKPFRMPDFFLISGLFLSVVIDRDWRTYLDRKVVHFAYFYVLWVTIQFGFKAPIVRRRDELAPCRLPVSGILHRAVRHAVVHLSAAGVLRGHQGDAAMPPLVIWGVAALLEMAHIATGWTVIDEFCARFVYFYSGYLFAGYVFALSDRARARPALALAGLALWALINGGLVASGFSEWPLISLALGLAGACAIVTIGTLLARMRWLNFLRFCGEHSIVIYLAFFLPMAATRTLLLRAGWIHDIGTISLIVTIVGVIGALAMWRMALAVGANFLFERPAAFWIAPKKAGATLQAAE